MQSPQQNCRRLAIAVAKFSETARLRRTARRTGAANETLENALALDAKLIAIIGLVGTAA